MIIHWSPNLRRPMVKRNASSILSPFVSVPAQRIRAVTNATSLPVVMLISVISKITGSSDQEKKISQVFLYASIPFDCTGGGTSNINRFGEWLARIPLRFLERTALAQLSTSARIAASSVALLLFVLIWISFVLNLLGVLAVRTRS